MTNIVVFIVSVLAGDRAVSLLCILFEHFESFLCAAFLLHDANSALESLSLRCTMRRSRATPSSTSPTSRHSSSGLVLAHPCRQLLLAAPWVLAGALCAALAVLTRDSGAVLVGGRLCVGQDLVLHLLRLCGAAACLSLLCALALVARCTPTPRSPEEPLSPETNAETQSRGRLETGSGQRRRGYQMALAPVSEAVDEETEPIAASATAENEADERNELEDAGFGPDESPAKGPTMSGSLLPVLSLYVDALEIPAHEHVFTVQQGINAAPDERIVNAQVTAFSPSSELRDTQTEIETSKVVGETSPNGQTGSESSGTSGYSTDEPAECSRAARAPSQATKSPVVSPQQSLSQERAETRVYSIHLQDSPIYSVLRRPPSPLSPRALGPIHVVSRFLRSPARRRLSFEYDDSRQSSPWHQLSEKPRCSLELKHSRTEPTLGAGANVAHDEDFLVCVRKPTVTFNDVAVVYMPCSEPSSTHDSPAISAAAPVNAAQEASTSHTHTHNTENENRDADTHEESESWRESESDEHLWTMERLTIISVCIFVLTWLPSLLAGLLLAACLHEERSLQSTGAPGETPAGVHVLAVRRGQPAASSLSGALGSTLAADVARLAEHVCRFRPELAVVAEYFEWAAYASALLYPLSVLVIDRRLARDLSRAALRVLRCRPSRTSHRPSHRPQQRATRRYPPAPVHTRKPPNSRAKI